MRYRSEDIEFGSAGRHREGGEDFHVLRNGLPIACLCFTVDRNDQWRARLTASGAINERLYTSDLDEAKAWVRELVSKSQNTPSDVVNETFSNSQMPQGFHRLHQIDDALKRAMPWLYIALASAIATLLGMRVIDHLFPH